MGYLMDTGRGLLALAFGAQPALASGWYEIRNGDCRDFDFDTLDRPRSVWLAFTGRNVEGDLVSFNIQPSAPGSLKAVSGIDLCLDTEGALERTGTMEEVQQCPAAAENPVTAPLSTVLTIPARTRGSTTFTVSSRSPGKVLHCPHRGLPAPSKAGTVNATFMGLPAVRWSNERRWYLYDKATPIPLWHPTRHDLSQAYYHFDRPQQPTVRARVGELLQQLKLRTTGSLREQAWIDETGRLSVSRTYTSGQSVETVNLAALNLQGATFHNTYEMIAKLSGVKPTPEKLAEHHHILIRCRSDAPGCVTRTSDMSKTSDQITVALNETALETVRATLLKIGELFRAVAVSVFEDPTCKCTRIVMKPQ